MAKIGIRWLREAEIQYNEIVLYWIEKTDSVSYVKKIKEDINSKLILLALTPRMCPIF